MIRRLILLAVVPISLVAGCGDAPVEPVPSRGSVVETRPTTPTGLSATVAGAAVQLGWTPGTGEAQVFEVRRQFVNGGVATAWVPLAGSLSAPEFLDEDVTSGTTYRYQVRGCNGAGCSGWSVRAAVTFAMYPPPAAVMNLDWTMSAGSAVVVMSWQAGDDVPVTRFDVRRRSRASGRDTWGTWEAVGTATTTTFSDSTAVRGRQYQYGVRACNDAGCSPWRTSVGFVAESLPLTVIDLTAEALSPTSVRVEWTPRGGNSDWFDVRRRDVSGRETFLRADATHLVDTGLHENRYYTYHVRSCNSRGCSQFGQSVRVLTQSSPSLAERPREPEDFTAVPEGDDRVRLTWTPLGPTATQFVLYRDETGAGGPLVEVATVTETTFTDGPVDPFRTYRYYLKACNAYGCSAHPGVITTIRLASIPEAPAALSATASSSTSVMLSWGDNSRYEERFDVQRRTYSGGAWQAWQSLPAAPADQHGTNDTSAQAATRYQYRVRACNVLGCSGWTQTSITTPG